MQGFLISILAWNNWWKLSHVIVITDAILKPVKSNFSARFGNNHSCIKNVITKAVLQTLENDPPSWKYSFKNPTCNSLDSNNQTAKTETRCWSFRWSSLPALNMIAVDQLLAFASAEAILCSFTSYCTLYDIMGGQKKIP